MTGLRKILFNAAMVYGRFLCAIICGIFTGRWMLAIFGERDYGLIGVIGSLIAIASFLNTVLSLAAVRQLSYHVGRYENESNNDNLEECRKWFGSACFLHALLAMVVVLIAFPVGCLAIREWLTIPHDRINDCVVFFSFSCVQLFLSIVTTPFNSMFCAKQRIAELSVYSIASIGFMFFAVWYMVSSRGDWFVKYAICSNAVAVVFSIIVMVRAVMLFSECRSWMAHMLSVKRSVAIMRIAFWQTFEMLAYVARNHGVTILVNKLFGPVYNASFTVANTVLTHASSTSQSLSHAFMPAMIGLEGAGRHGEMTEKMFVYCKISSGAYCLLVLPLILELNYVLKLWLVNPPAFVCPVCSLLLTVLFFDCLTSGFGAAAIAINRLGKFYGFIGVASMLMLALMCVAVKCGEIGFVGMFIVMTGVRILANLVSVKLADDVIGFGIPVWCKKVLLPFSVTTLISVMFAWSVRILMTEGFLRLCVTTSVFVTTFSLFAWLIILSNGEKNMFRNYIASVAGKFFRKSSVYK